jgi:iron complex transport system substrate-binding protein
MRIASLLASATEAVYALGLADQLVAVSHECDYPPAARGKPRISRPRFDAAGLNSGQLDAAVRRAMSEHGAVYAVDQDLVRELAPELILSQAVCEVCAVPTSMAEQVARALTPPPRVVSLDSHSIQDILDGILAIGTAAGVPQRAERYVAGLTARLAGVRAAVNGRPAPRVLAIEWLDPPFVPGHWTPEMVQWAGGALLAGSSGRPSHEVSWDTLAAREPDVLVVMPCGFGLAATQSEADRFADRLARVAPRAVESGNAFVVDGSAYFNRSGPRMVDGVELLGALLHPDCFPNYRIEGKARVWTPPRSEET